MEKMRLGGRLAGVAAARKDFSPRPLAVAVVAVWPLLGLTQARAADEAQLRDVVVTASRVQSDAQDLAGSISLVSRRQMAERGAFPADALADEPDVSLPADPRRFGAGHVNLRGIEDNRVLMLTDGVRAADFRSPGTTNYDASNRDIPFVEFLKQVEIVRGPASSLYGSDAIGGVLGFLTLDPADLLKSRSLATGARLGHYSADSSTRAMVYAAAGGARVQALLMVGQAKGEETDNQGTLAVQGLRRTAPNPIRYEQRNVLGKLTFAPATAHHFKLTLEHKDSETEVDAQRVGNTSPGRQTT
ncbi:MAG: TonB-dependent receptor plug domain-containing protein [Uliginosibacterium sp.]|nr:TonB-dependent receptor plug domain-containing protein [Uliginosibacterium sp.]